MSGSSSTPACIRSPAGASRESARWTSWRSAGRAGGRRSIWSRICSATCRSASCCSSPWCAAAGRQKDCGSDRARGRRCLVHAECCRILTQRVVSRPFSHPPPRWRRHRADLQRAASRVAEVRDRGFVACSAGGWRCRPRPIAMLSTPDVRTWYIPAGCLRGRLLSRNPGGGVGTRADVAARTAAHGPRPPPRRARDNSHRVSSVHGRGQSAKRVAPPSCLGSCCSRGADDALDRVNVGPSHASWTPSGMQPRNRHRRADVSLVRAASPRASA